MNSVFSEMLKQSPLAAGLLVVVFIFINHLEHRDAMFAETLREVGESCHVVQLQTVKALERNTDVLIERGHGR